VVLLVQNTTFELCPRSAGARRGHAALTVREEYLLHPSVAFSENRVDLGVLGHHFWQGRAGRGDRRREVCPLEEKESYRWLPGHEMACALQHYIRPAAGLSEQRERQALRFGQSTP